MPNPPQPPLPDAVVPEAPRLQEFALHYQPVVTAGTRQMRAVEALLRWKRGGERRPLEAAGFLPMAERSGLIVELGAWAVRSACAQFAAWRGEGLALDFVAVNVSPRQLADAGFVASVEGALRSCHLAPSHLQLECSAATLAGAGHPPPALVELARRGVRLALDDCGPTYDVRPVLAALPLAALKLDAACVTALPGDASLRAYLGSLVASARASGSTLVAEGVESEEQLEFLERSGVDAMQGFLLAPPLPAEAVAGVVRDVAAGPRLVA